MKFEPNDLPKWLMDLTFGSDFNQPLETGVLPDALQYLRFGYPSSSDRNARYSVDLANVYCTGDDSPRRPHDVREFPVGDVWCNTVQHLSLIHI